MAIAVIVSIPSQEAYDTVSEAMFGSKRSTEVVEGNILHSAGEGPNGFRVVDVWESREAFDNFMNDRVMPAMKEAGIEMEGQGSPPEIVEIVHMVMNQEARV